MDYLSDITNLNGRLSNVIVVANSLPDIDLDSELLRSFIERSTIGICDNKLTGIGTQAFRGCVALTTVDFPLVTTIGTYAFYGCSALTTVDFPLVTKINSNAFEKCTSLTSVSFPLATSLQNASFRGCTSLISVTFPSVTLVNSYSFNGCTNLKSADFPVATSIGTYNFTNDSSFTTLILRANSVCKLGGTNAFTSTPIASGTGYIYVPSALVDTYKTATNWSTYANQFRALEDYTVDGTITGELDTTKI